MNDSTALIIEDDLDLIHIFARALELSGYKTQTVSNGKEAVVLLSQIVPDIVVLDLHLPGLSGNDVLQYIRTDKRLVDTQIILATADYRMADDLRDLADLVLLKPISFKQLRDLSGRLREAKHSV